MLFISSTSLTTLAKPPFLETADLRLTGSVATLSSYNLTILFLLALSFAVTLKRVNFLFLNVEQ